MPTSASASRATGSPVPSTAIRASGPSGADNERTTARSVGRLLGRAQHARKSAADMGLGGAGYCDRVVGVVVARAGRPLESAPIAARLAAAARANDGAGQRGARA